MSDTNTTASGRLHAPAVGLIVTGILGVLLQLGSIVNELLGNPLQQAMLDFLAAQGMDTASFDSLPLSGGLLFGTQFVLQLVMGLVFLALSGFVAWGGFQMLRQRHHSACIAAAIAACLPCSACCCLGLPFGIWAIVALNRADVRSAFGEA
jgi:hypothetical protein